ncbi:MAG: tRNA pseudouridine(55) synthase TruB, partial [Chloroflexota bacterium]
MVGRLRRLLRMKKIGHAGTLDPFASGLLVVAAGKATRLLRFAQAQPKTYLAHIRLGVDTTTADRDGEVLGDPAIETWPSGDAVSNALSGFRGRIEQVPPSYSAIRVGGKRAYARARAGEHVEMPVREVQIHHLDVIEYDPP